MSLDGYIALPDGDPGPLHDWLIELASWRRPHGLEGGAPGLDDEVFRKEFARPGAIVIGRRMFDQAEEPWGAEPPFHMPVFIVTHRARATEAKKGGTTYTFVTDGVESALSQARAEAGDKDVSVAGASTIQQFINAGLLDEIVISLVPVVLGKGVPLFANLDPSVRLEKTRAVDGVVTHLWYRIVKEGS